MLKGKKSLFSSARCRQEGVKCCCWLRSWDDGPQRRETVGVSTVGARCRRGRVASRRGLQANAGPRRKGQEGFVPGVSGLVGRAAAVIHSWLGFFSWERNSARASPALHSISFGGADCRCLRPSGRSENLQQGVRCIGCRLYSKRSCRRSRGDSRTVPGQHVEGSGPVGSSDYSRPDRGRWFPWPYVIPDPRVIHHDSVAQSGPDLPPGFLLTKADDLRRPEIWNQHKKILGSM
ncbi:hypothetical protein VTI74DRAFT_10787 [Chaetomium olivicolor]